MDFLVLPVPNETPRDREQRPRERFFAPGNEVGSGRESRRRHLLAYSHLLGGDADEMDQPRWNSADYLEYKSPQTCQRIIAARQNADIGPRVDILFNCQKEEVTLSAPFSKLRAIGILSPADAPKQFAICRMERDEVTAAPMVRPEDKLVRPELRKSALNVTCPKCRAIPAYGNNFLIAKPRNSLDRILEASGEVAPHLSVNAWAGEALTGSRREKVKVNLRGKLGGRDGET